MYLNCHSYFSLNYGVLSVSELLEHASGLGIRQMALTDINNTSGCLDFLRLAPKYNIKPAIGIDFRNTTEQLYVGIARNNEGFRELNEFLTAHITQHKPLPEKAPEFKNCLVIYPWERGMKTPEGPNEYVGLKPKDTASFRFYAKHYPLEKVIAFPTGTFRNKQDFNTHRLLRAIGLNTLLSKLEKKDQADEWDSFTTLHEVVNRYEDWPKMVHATTDILKSCRVSFEFGKSKNKETFLANREEDKVLLKQLAEEGLKYRYGNPTQEIRQRFDFELQTIIDLGFTAYFLINWDIVRFAKSKGFYHVGRGSGANSLIAYCLQITDVDPIELNLYFERFINASRKSPPDFDIDFSHTDRDEVRQYIFDKYGDRAALVGSYSTFERKSCIRELGKVFGLPDYEIDRLQGDRLQVKDLDTIGKTVLKYAPRLHGLPNSLSIHACGILISELPITYYTALELKPVGFVSTQFSMLEAEDVGLYKYDILSQRGLGHIKDAVAYVKQNHGIELDIHKVQEFKKDPVLNARLKVGNTVGCFYIESPAMRQLLKKLQVEDYLGLVAASSVIRPGVASSGMMREYILRYRDPEKRKDAFPKLLAIMPETFGVMVYQEDVIKVAHYYAGLTLEHADVMRRGMSGKFRSREEFQAVKEAFFENCKQKGYPEEEAREIWRQLESFAGYSFAKGHSASYAVESYQSLYLRTYYPVEFMAAVVNNFGGFYSTEFYLHEARMVGADVQLPCVNRSDALSFLAGQTLYLGLGLIKDLEKASIQNILAARQEGPFTGLSDFTRRVAISLEQLRILIRIQAFRFTGKSSKELMWDAHLLLGKVKRTAPKRELFTATVEKGADKLPRLDYEPHEQALSEIEILGFPYTSPFSLLERDYKGIVYAKELIHNIGNVVYMMGYYVNTRDVSTIHGDYMAFGCFIDSKGDLFDTVHFPQSIEKYPFEGKGCYLLKGTVLEDFGVPNVEVSNMKRIPWVFNSNV